VLGEPPALRASSGRRWPRGGGLQSLGVTSRACACRFTSRLTVSLQYKPRQDTLYAGAEINRLYAKNISSTSNQATQRQNEASRA
jgi:hypothetical protein